MFATYLHSELCTWTKPQETISFAGHSVPYFQQIRNELAKAFIYYPQLPLQQVSLNEYIRVHDVDYLYGLQAWSQDQPYEPLPKLGNSLEGMQYALPSYLYSLGGMFSAIDQMKLGQLERFYSFSLGGHHAYPNWGHGYCLLNPQAVAVRYAQAQGFTRALVVDWDLHHGDGTQVIFANDPTVCCISSHSAFDLYMAIAGNMRNGTVDAGKVIGHINIPILHDLYSDESAKKMQFGTYYRAHNCQQAIQNALKNLPWEPDIIFIFAGFDGHVNDQGSRIMAWTDEDFANLTKMVLATAKRAHCPILSVHGGGYTLPVIVSAAVQHVSVLAEG